MADISTQIAPFRNQQSDNFIILTRYFVNKKSYEGGLGQKYRPYLVTLYLVALRITSLIITMHFNETSTGEI